MAEYELFSVRLPKKQLDLLKDQAAREGVPVASVIRELLDQAQQRRTTSVAVDPLIEALHHVLPVYLNPLADAVISTRFDAVIAREMAQAAVLAGLMAQPGMTEDRARELATNTMGRAVKRAKKRVRETPDLSLEEAQ